MAILALQSASTALNSLNTALDVSANNLANINTAGFRQSRVNFQDLLYLERAQPGVENANGDQRPTGIYVGLGVRVAGTQVDFTQGSAVQTERPLDLYIEGDGFFRVSVGDLAPNGFAYTRDGQFTLNANGEIVLATDTGRRLDPVITVDDDVVSVSISADGIVSAKRRDQAEPIQIGEIELVNFINPTGLAQLGENLFAQTGASGPEIAGRPGSENFGQIRQGMYEASNVDPTRELIELIRTQRAFEMNSQTIRSADEALRTISQLRR